MSDVKLFMETAVAFAERGVLWVPVHPSIKTNSRIGRYRIDILKVVGN